MAKILLYTLVFSPDQVSNAYVLTNLVRGLREYGHEIKVLTTTPHYQPPDDETSQPLIAYKSGIYKSDFEGIECYHIKVPAKKGGLVQRALTALKFHLKSLAFGSTNVLNCDVVIALTPPPTMGLIGSYIARKHRAASIFTIYDMLSETFFMKNGKRKTVFVRALRMLETLTFRRCDALVGVTPSSLDLIRSRAPKEKRVEVISVSVDTSVYYPISRDNEFSRTHGLSDNFVVSYVGNLGMAQDFTPLPEAALRCSGKPIKFIMVGGGVKLEALRRESQNLGSPNWEIWGYQPQPVTPLINGSSDLCLVLLTPDFVKGSFPSKLYTIMACKRPVLYYGPGDADIACMIRENNIGWVVETGNVDGFVNAIHEAYDNPELRGQMGENALNLVQDRYSSQAVAQQYHELIEKMLTKK